MCVRYATAGAMTTYAQRAGSSDVYSPSFLGQVDKEMMGLPPGDHAIRWDQEAAAVERFGMALDSEFQGYNNWSLSPGDVVRAKALARRPITLRQVVWRNDDPVETIKWYIGHGMSVLLSMLVPRGYRDAVQGVPWRQQVVPVLPSVYEHAMECIGYDDDAKRVQCINSEGSAFGDYGMAGLEYKNLVNGPSRIVYQLWVIDQTIYPLKKVEGFMPGLATLTPAELGPEVALRRAALKAAEDAATEAKRVEWTERVLRNQPANATGWQWAVDALVKEGLTDRNADIVFRQAPGWFLLQAQALGLDTSKLAKDPF